MGVNTRPQGEPEIYDFSGGDDEDELPGELAEAIGARWERRRRGRNKRSCSAGARRSTRLIYVESAKHAQRASASAAACAIAARE